MRRSENRIHHTDVPVVRPQKSSRAPEIRVDQMMQRIREELILAGRTDLTPFPVLARSTNADLDQVADFLSEIAAGVHSPALVRLSLKDPTHVPAKPTLAPAAQLNAVAGRDIPWKEVAALDGVAFIQTAYLAILGREADADGLTCYGAMLRDGAPKIEILGRICDSAEARQRQASLAGLALPYRIDKVRRWPVLGRLLSILIAIWRLPEAERNYRRLSCELMERIHQHDEEWSHARTEIHDALRLLERSQNSLGDLTRLLASRNQFDAIRQSLIQVIASIRALQMATGRGV